jgi:hypothetical protein
MTYRKWIIGVVASMVPWMVQAQGRVFDAPQRVDGLVVYLDFEPATVAPSWADSHRSSGVDAGAPAVRPELDRHLVVAVVEELTGERVGDARIEVTLTPTGPPGGAFIGTLELMKRGSPASYGTTMTIDPLVEYTLELTIRRPDHAEPSRVRFGPARIPLRGSHGDLRKEAETVRSDRLR